MAQRVPGDLGSQISWHSAREGVEGVSLTHRPPLPQGLFLVHIFTRTFSKNYTVKVYWHLSGTCCLRFQGTRTQRHIGALPYLQDHRAWHPRIQYWLPISMFMIVRYCRCPFLASCASLPLDAHLCMKYCVTSSMGWIYCLTVLSCRIGFCTLVRKSRHASPCLQHSPWY
jgi:hypothetical protein